MRTGSTMLMAAEVLGYIGRVEHNPRVMVSRPVFHTVLELLNEQWESMPQLHLFKDNRRVQRRPRRRRATLESIARRYSTCP